MLSNDIINNLKEKNRMFSLSQSLIFSIDRDRNKRKIEELADKLIEREGVASTDNNVTIARQKAHDILMQESTSPYEQDPSGFNKQKPAYNTMGRILK